MKSLLPLALAATCALGCATAAPPSQRPASTSSPNPGNTTNSDTSIVSRVEVSREASEVFGGSIPAAPADAVRRASPGAAKPTWDIDVRSFEAQERVARYVRLFTSGDVRTRFEERLERGSRYEPMIRAKLRAGGIPEDMSYLALIESGYDPHAYSRAAAVGMWQFMAGTARGVGLRVDWWVDERRDPVRSTEAAVKVLGWLREQFGSMYLAATAYNAGDARLARGLSRFADDIGDTTGDEAFFTLAEKDFLPDETKNYVPQLIAAALVAKDPARYHLSIRTVPPLAYDSVTVPPSTPLMAVAKAAGVSIAEILDLNPHILRGVTPPDASYRVRVPVGHAGGFEDAFHALAPSERGAFSVVTSAKGQSIASIAATHGLTAHQLAWYNTRLATVKGGKLRPDQTVLIPSRSVVSAALDVPEPIVERKATKPTPTRDADDDAPQHAAVPAAKTSAAHAAAVARAPLQAKHTPPTLVKSVALKSAGGKTAASRHATTAKGATRTSVAAKSHLATPVVAKHAALKGNAAKVEPKRNAAKAEPKAASKKAAAKLSAAKPVATKAATPRGAAPKAAKSAAPKGSAGSGGAKKSKDGAAHATHGKKGAR